MSAYSALVLAHANLQLYWRLGDAVSPGVDSGPNNLTPTYAASNGLTLAVAGALTNDADGAVSFDGTGTGDPITTGDVNALDLGDGPFSLEFWVKRSATQGTQQTILSKGNTSGNGAYEVRFVANNTLSLFKQGTAGAVITKTGAITDTNWHHCVITKNGTSRAFYFDGVEATTLGTNQTLQDTTANFQLGSQPTGTNRLVGSLDEVALYNAVLSADEVLAHYRAGKGILTPAVTTSTAQALDVDKKVTLTSATTTSAAQALSYAKPIRKTLTPATETDSAQALTFTKPLRQSITPASETDSAQSVSFVKTIYKTLDPAIEQDEAQPLSQQGRTYLSITPATETDEAQALTFQTISTTDGGGMPAVRKRKKPLERIGPPHLVFLGSAYELDQAVPLTYRKEPNLHAEDEELLAILGVA